MKKITKSILYILLAVAIMIPMGSAFASPDDADDAFPSLYPEWPFTPLEWVLHNIDALDIDKWGYEQYDVINAVHRGIRNSYANVPGTGSGAQRWLGPGTMNSTACRLPDDIKYSICESVMVGSTRTAGLPIVDGPYYDAYMALLDAEAYAIKAWLADMAEPREGEDWQTHLSRIAQTEYMFEDAPGYWWMVEPSRRLSILGCYSLSDNKDFQKIEAWTEYYMEKFQEECYFPGKEIEYQIACMDPSDPASVAAARAAYDELDNFTKSVVMNYELLTRAEGFVNADGTDKIHSNFKHIGMRKPVGGDTGFSAANHERALYDLLRATPDAKPWYIWIAGNSSGNLLVGTTSWAAIEASGVMQHPQAYYTGMGISISNDAIMEAWLTYLDAIPGAEVYLQVENMNRMVEPQMDILRYVATRHPSVKGFAMDIEWYNHNAEDCGLRVSNERCKAWNEYIYATWGEKYQLALKHYDAAHLPDTYRGGEEGLSNPVVFVDDTQNYGSWDGSHGGRYNSAATGNGSSPANGNDWALFAEFFYPNDVIFQTGYQHDEQWSYSFDAVDYNMPLYLRSHANKITEVVNPDQNIGMAWVNFNRNGYPEFPNASVPNGGDIPGASWRTSANHLSELATRTINYLNNYNGDSNNLLGGVWGFYSNAAGRQRTLENNPITYPDAKWAYNVRQYANALIAKGAAASNFTGNAQYGRFLGVEARAWDFMVAYRYEILMNYGGYIEARDLDDILMLIDMYEGLLPTACVFPTGVDAVAGYANGALQTAAVRNVAVYEELLRLAFGPYNVEFIVDGESYATEVVVKGEPVAEPAMAAKDFFIFDGWYLDADYTVAFDFGTGISKDYTVYARYISFADYLSAKAGGFLKNGIPLGNLVLEGKVLKLVFDDGFVLILSTNANNRNIDGKVAIGGGKFLVFDLKGNGSNIKKFEIV